MAVSFYMDVHVPQAVTEQLTRRGIDVVTAIADGADQKTDVELLQRATELGRVTVTFDIGFKSMAEEWQRTERRFAGLIFAHAMRASIGQLVHDLELVATATEPSEWQGVIEHLPL